MNKDVSQQVCFQTVLERVKAQLGPSVADPQLIEIFDFLISNGAGKNAYVDNFLDWANVFVNSKLRQLRFSALKPINEMPIHQPARLQWASERAVENQPMAFAKIHKPHGVPSPGAINMFEELLRFFYTQCSALLSTFTTHARLKLLGEVDIVANEAIYIGMTAKGAKKEAKQQLFAIKEMLLTATLQFAEDLKLVGEGSRICAIANKPEWITFEFTPPEENPRRSRSHQSRLLKSRSSEPASSHSTRQLVRL